jgi:REP element-mobilizing transposase RayT
MGRPIRFIPANSLVEITARTLQGRFLFKPSPGWRETFVGVLARAQKRYPLRIHAFVCLSNHYHLLVSPQDAYQLAAFMRYFNTNLSKEAGRLHRWRGTLIHRRYSAILVSNEPAAQVARLRYLLSHGVKEGLVWKAEQWPGPHCARALATDTPSRGIWHDRSHQFATPRNNENTGSADSVTRYELPLEPLPCWDGLDPASRRRYVAELNKEIEAEARELHRQRRTHPLGRAAVLRQHPQHRPERVAWSPSILVHTTSRQIRNDFLLAYREFLTAFQTASRRFRRGDRIAVFPLGSFAPGLYAVRAGPA